MHFIATIAALALTLTTGASARATGMPQARDSTLLADFSFGAAPQCPLVAPHEFTFPEGYQGLGACVRCIEGDRAGALDLKTIDPKCLLTLFNTYDCSDPGIVSGTAGCWALQGGIAAFKLTCPYKK